MGCDIHTFVEVRRNGRWELENRPVFEVADYDRQHYDMTGSAQPFNWRHYAMFGLLAHVRRKDGPCIAQPRGWPKDLSSEMAEEQDQIDHTPSYLTLAELLAFDYNQPWTPHPDEPERNTVRTALNERFFRDIEVLRTLGEPEEVRVLFHFDS